MFSSFLTKQELLNTCFCFKRILSDLLRLMLLPQRPHSQYVKQVVVVVVVVVAVVVVFKMF